MLFDSSLANEQANGNSHADEHNVAGRDLPVLNHPACVFGPNMPMNTLPTAGDIMAQLSLLVTGS